ncbi:hypothetical protein SLE2022_061090 [Rubroshorea leprosula]
MKPEGIDQWREFFGGANSSIFEIIDHAISVAAKDHPEEFKLQRCQIVDKLYSSELNQCPCHNHNELPNNKKSSEECDTGANGSLQGNGNAGDDLGVIGGSKDGDEIDICQNDPQEINTNQPIKNSCSEAEALTADTDEEKEIICELDRIREVVQNEDQSERVLLDSLKRLQLIDLSFEILKKTEIGKPVNLLRKHNSSQIRKLARSLILAWRIKVDKWLEAKETIAGSEKHSVDFNPSGIDEEGGLPQPALDGAAFLTPQFPMQISHSQSIDGMDNKRNLQNSVKIEANCGKGKSQSTSLPIEKNMLVMDVKQQPVKQESVFKPIEAKSSDIKTMPWNIKKQSSEPGIIHGIDLQRTNNTTLMRKEWLLKNQQETKETWKRGDAENGRKQQDSNMKLTKPVNTIISKAESYKNSDSVRAPADHQALQQKFKPQEKNTIREKLEVAKRKLEQDHQQLEKAKNQRTTQMTDVKDLPRPAVGPKNLNMNQKYQKWHQENHRN